jgi:hypothetical protein
VKLKIAFWFLLTLKDFLLKLFRFKNHNGDRKFSSRGASTKGI